MTDQTTDRPPQPPSQSTQAGTPALLTTSHKPQATILPAAILCLYAVVLCVPWRLDMPSNSLDGSWILLMNVAFARHLHFGPDIIFTYGPWSFLISRCYYPQTYHLFTVIWVCIEIVVAASVWHIGMVHFRKKAAAFVWSLVFLTTLAPLIPIMDHRDAFFIFLPVVYALLVLEPESNQSWPLRVSLAIVLALAGFMKFTFLVIGVVVVVWGAVHTGLRSRKMSWDLPVFALGLCVFWLLAGQPLSLFGVFLVNAASVASGYTAAMSLEGRPRSLEVFLALAAGLAWMVVTLPKLRRSDKISLSCVVACVGFEAFKEGFVREDQMHLAVAFWTLIAIFLILIPLRWGESWRDKRVLVAAGLFVFLVGTVAARSGIPASALLSAVNVPGTAWGNLKIAAPLALGRDPYRAAFEDTVADIRGSQPFPHLPGTVDIYSRNLAGLILSGLTYTPRPIFQGYSAYTPHLAAMNRAFLEGPRAPDWILYNIETIDERFPPLDDGPSWTTILSRYRPFGSVGDFLILKRQIAPTSVSLEPLESRTGEIDQPIPIPACSGNSAIWAQIDLHETLGFHVAEVLFKPAYFYLDVTTASGEKQTYRVVPAIAREGFALSPLMRSGRQFGELSEGKWGADMTGQEITSITVRSTGRTVRIAGARHTFELKLSRLVVR